MDLCRFVKVSRGSNCFFGENDDIDRILKFMNSILMVIRYLLINFSFVFSYFKS